MALFCLLSVSADEKPSLQEGFMNPPKGGGAQTWWHWTSNFVTKKGITADLEAMKAIGYEGAHLFTTTSTPIAPGASAPEMLSPEWMELLDYAGREAQRLGLTLGVHNCPGWSLSGGPWIQPEDAMQMIVSSEVNITGGSHQRIPLPQPEIRNGYYRDIRVLAFPDVNRHEPPTVTADFTGQPLENILDDDNTSFIRLPISQPGSQASVTLAYDEPYSPQFIELTFGEIHLFVKGLIEASADGKTYREAARFDYKIRTDLRQPKCIRLNEAARDARFFRVTFYYRPYRAWMRPANVQLNRMRLLASSMVSDVDSRNSAMEDAFSYKPFEADYTTPGADPSQVIDLSDRLEADGTLDWDVPAGNWTILRIGHTPTGKTNGPTSFRGLECNKLDRRGLNAHWPEMMKKIEAQLAHTGVLKYAIIDSYEAGGQNWTEGFEQEFLKRRGYDMKPYFPAVVGYVVGTPQQSARFLYDFQRTISDLFAENYYDYFAELCHRDGLMAITEAYFGPFDYLRCARNADVPTGEFWVGSGTPISRMPGSAAHVQGRKRVAAESFTTDAKPGRWQQDPRELKEYGDRAWIQGVSQLVSHSFVHQPFLNVRPGMTLGRNGSHLSRTNTWWPYGGDWVKYMNRSQFLLQSGLPVADILVLSGESAPNNFPKDTLTMRAGYNYDFCCVDDLRELIRVQNGRIVAPSGVTYACLSLGDDRYLTLKTLQKVYELIEQGACVSGIPPLGTPSLSDNEQEHAAMVTRLWGDTRPGESRIIGKGRLIHSASHPEVMRILGVLPDVTLAENVDGIHRQVGDTDIYFIYNDSTRVVTQDAKFRVLGNKIPEFWYADEGRIEAAPVWRREGELIVVPMTLIPRESRFVVFRPGESTTHLLQADLPGGNEQRPPVAEARTIDGQVKLLFSEPAQVDLVTAAGKAKTVTVKKVPTPLDLTSDWQVRFPADHGAPDSIHLDQLISLSEYPSDSVRYFSGTASYRQVFELPKGWKSASRRLVLDLGTVRNLAEVKVNGQKIGLLWKTPFSIDLTEALQEGENTLEIAVTNLWVNRLIGDARNTKPVAETEGWPDWVVADKTHSEAGHYSYSPWKGWSAEEELQPAGLIGPVRLKCLEVR